MGILHAFNFNNGDMLLVIKHLLREDGLCVGKWYTRLFSKIEVYITYIS